MWLVVGKKMKTTSHAIPCMGLVTKGQKVMREIKFRAWHKGYPGMGPTKAIEPRMLYEDRQGECLTWKEQGQPLVVMQFTGLLDKNGKEIYEGDILKCVSEKISLMSNRPTGEVTTKIKTIEWQQEWARFQLKVVGHTSFELLPCTKQEWITQFYEVIGNRYEHPHLISELPGR